VGVRQSAGPSGARERFEQLYGAQLRPLLGYALRRVDRPEEAADVVAEVMLVAWRRLGDVPVGHDARLWLFGVARRILANQRRGGFRRDRLSHRLRQELGHLVWPDHAAGIATDLTVRAALDALPEEDREILQLAAWEDLHPREIAVVLGIPAVTARSRLHRARQRLRRSIEDEREGERSAWGGQVVGDGRALVRDAEDDR
jgi:RNA polymerase sigma factor (sigma-70 family)